MTKLVWRDAYTTCKTTLNEVKGEFGEIALCTTHGKVVYQDKTYTVLQYNFASHGQGDYFVIPTSLIMKGKHAKKKKTRCSKR